jgi:multidrug efflux pump subunit AcrB
MNKFSISAIAIRRHVGTIALTLTAIVMGIFLLSNIQVDLLPSITYPRIGLRLDAPGVSPDVAIEEITKPLEESLSATDGVVQVYSQTREGSVSLDLYFEPGENVDQALNEATAAFNRAQGRLPSVVENARLFKVDPSNLPVYEFALRSSTLKDLQLRVFAQQQLARELGVVKGVASVTVSGGVEEEIQVRIDPIRLQALGLGLNTVLNELRDRNLDVSGGRLSGGREELLTRTTGKFKTAKDLENIAFTINSGNNLLPQKVYLRDFAEIIDGAEEQKVFVALNGEPAVKLSVQKQQDANSIEVVNNIQKRIEQLKLSGLIPANMELKTTLDESIFIRNSVNNVLSSGLTGTVLAALAVLLFLGSLRQTFIVVISIPLATLSAVVLMQLFGLSLNIFSLGGLALGVGIVVDNAIVMLETIAESVMNLPKEKHLKVVTKEQILATTAASSSAIESALLASTNTNLVSVLPFLLIGGFFSLLFNELILTISFSVASSLLIALTVVPMLASQLLGITYRSNMNNWWFFRKFNERFISATNGYQKILQFILKYRLIVITLAFVILGGGSVNLGGQLSQEILPRINTGQANLNAQFPAGTTLAENRKVMDAIDKLLLKQPETKSVFTTAGGSLFGANVNSNVLRGSSTIELKPGTNVENYIEKVTKQLDKFNLVDTRLRISPGQVRGIILNNSPVRADLDIGLQSNDFATLQKVGRQLLNTLDEKVTLARFRPEGEPTQEEILIKPDWERVAEFGLSTQTIGQVIQTAIEGSVPTELQRGDRLVDLRVKLPDHVVNDLSLLRQVPLLVGNGRSLRLEDIAKVEIGKAPGQIQRINQSQVFLIGGTLNEGARLGDAIAQTKAILAELKLPEGITIIPSSTEETNQLLQNNIKILGGLATFLVFVVMAVQYNSWIDPLVIMFTVPLALAGGVCGLYITETPVGATVLVGAVLLVGIVVNNAIIMVEFANELHEQKRISRRQAILEAAPQRLRPVLMTTITTVLGMFPMALGIGDGAEFLQPLGIVVFSGLSLATFLTLFIIPCFYTLLHELFAGKKPSTYTPSQNLENAISSPIVIEVIEESSNNSEHN